MAFIKVPTTFNIDVEFEVPEFYRRLFALLIDRIVLVLYSIIAAKIFKAIMMDIDRWDDDGFHNLWAVYMIIVYAPPLFYHFVMEITMNGQSPGKRLMNIRVVHENGGRASISQYAIRWLLRDTWFLMLLGFATYIANTGATTEAVMIVVMVIGFFITDLILVVSSKKGQRLGDILAHTIVIKTNTKGRIEETVFMEVADNYVPIHPQIMQLSDKDINAIKGILETARKKGDFYMAEQASDKIKAHLQIDSNLSPFDFLDLLLKDYNSLSTK